MKTLFLTAIFACLAWNQASAAITYTPILTGEPAKKMYTLLQELQKTNKESNIIGEEYSSGGDINGDFRVQTKDGRYFRCWYEEENSNPPDYSCEIK